MLAHLETAFSEIERMIVVYNDVIEKLKCYMLPNLTAQSAMEWFKMYLRIVDMGVQIRRGEIRHRTVQRFSYPCMHKTGTKGAMHSGLSIDDCNAILQLMEEQKEVNESVLDEWFRRMDILDRDVVGLIDKSVTTCLEDFQRQSSVFYDRVEVTGKDPYQTMVLLGGSGGPASILAKVTRTCFGPENCSCMVDAAPWENFCLKSGDHHAVNLLSNGVADVTNAAQVEEGIMNVKRKLGFKILSSKDEKKALEALAHDVAEPAWRRISRERTLQGVVCGQIEAISAQNIYQKMCEYNCITPKQHIKALLIVKKGSHYLNLSSIGFHSEDDLGIMVDIFSTPGLPPVKELDMSCGFFNAAAFKMMCKLLRVQLLRQSIERLSLRGIALPARSDFATLMRILTNKASSSLSSLLGLSNLKMLDISFNTLWFEGATLLRPMLYSLQHLEELSLESCFPDITSSFEMSFSLSYQETIKQDVCCALAEVSTRLERLNFGLNAIESRWLDGILSPGSTIQTLDLYGMSISAGLIGSVTASMDVEAGDVWDLQHVKTMSWSSDSDVLSNKLLGVLSDALRSGFAQMVHLDLAVNVSSDHEVGLQMDRKVADAIRSISDYAVLRSCRLKYYARSTISDELTLSISNLLESGLQECAISSLRVPQLYLGKHAICELLSSAYLLRMKKMTLAVGFIANDGRVQPDCKSCFLHMHKMQELTIECHVAIDEQSDAYEGVRTYLIAFARELELSWLALNASASDVERRYKSARDHSDGELNRSFVFLERQNPTKWIARFQFSATPLSR